MDDFGIKYELQADINNILDSLKKTYMIYEEWDVKLYFGLNLEWDYYKQESQCQIM